MSCTFRKKCFADGSDGSDGWVSGCTSSEQGMIFAKLLALQQSSQFYFFLTITLKSIFSQGESV
jgi:hypothetical protein